MAFQFVFFSCISKVLEHPPKGPHTWGHLPSSDALVYRIFLKLHFLCSLQLTFVHWSYFQQLLITHLLIPLYLLWNPSIRNFLCYLNTFFFISSLRGYNRISSSWELSLPALIIKRSCEHTVRWQPPRSQEHRPHKKPCWHPDLRTPCLHNGEKINLCCLCHFVYTTLL